MEQQFIMMIGISGSGKSYFANKIADKGGHTIIESDAIREEQYGNAMIQGDNVKLFAYIQNLIEEKLLDGESVVFDATNISHKYRRACIQKIISLKILVEKKAILVATPVEDCVRNNSERERTIPENVIRRQLMGYAPPSYREGFDKIEIIWNLTRDSLAEFDIPDLLDGLDDFDQNNENHEFTLGKHIRTTHGYAKELSTRGDIYYASLLHDIGKPATKVEHTMKGVPTKNSHYYGHESYGAYLAMFYLTQKGLTDGFILETCLLIALHMRPYFMKSEKSIRKFILQFGEDTYEKILIINQADRLAH